MNSFTQRVRPFVRAELNAARFYETRAQHSTAFKHLERAHVLGQSSTSEHVRVHIAMLGWAIRRQDAKEALGQLWRIVGALLMTPWGAVPRGNTGGTSVSGFKPLPIAPDLQHLMDSLRTGTTA